MTTTITTTTEPDLVYRFSDLSWETREELSKEAITAGSPFRVETNFRKELEEFSNFFYKLEKKFVSGLDPDFEAPLLLQQCLWIIGLFVSPFQPQYYRDPIILPNWSQTRTLFEFAQIATEGLSNPKMRSIRFEHAYQAANLNRIHRELSWNQLVWETSNERQLSQPGSYLFRYEFAQLLEDCSKYNHRLVARAIIETAVASLEETPLEGGSFSPVQFTPMVSIRGWGLTAEVPSESLKHCLFLQDVIQFAAEQFNVGRELFLREMHIVRVIGEEITGQEGGKPHYYESWQYPSLPLNVYSSMRPVKIRSLKIEKPVSEEVFNQIPWTRGTVLRVTPIFPDLWERRVQKTIEQAREKTHYLPNRLWAECQNLLNLPKEIINIVKEYQPFIFDSTLERDQEIKSHLAKRVTPEMISPEELDWMTCDMAQRGITLEEVKDYHKSLSSHLQFLKADDSAHFVLEPFF